MPNWCSNSITIQGSTETIKTLWEQAQTNWKNEDYGLLNAMVPMPEALKGTRSPAPDDGSQPYVDGHTNWYDWCVANWGTKWDIDDQGLEFKDNGDGTAQISGWFESAWAPPITAYDKFLDDMDGCSLYATYEEGGMDFAGIYDDGSDDYMEGISEPCEAIIRGTETLEDQTELFQRLEEEFDLIDNRREYVEEMMLEEDEQEVVVN
tara:strand:- start:262 stop:882 length:621 start_codon:yes stop_codon:yes gene_type:complete